MPLKTESEANPYRDEPEMWKELSPTQLMEAWYEIGHVKQLTQLSETLNAESFIQAAGKGDSQAQYTLGKMFYNGVCTGRSYFQAAFWYSKASAAGNPFADYELAKMCKFGIGIEKEATKAKQLFADSYQAFLSLENLRPEKAVEAKLAVICENMLADDANSYAAIDWRRKAEGIPQIVAPDIPVSAKQVRPIEEVGEADQRHLERFSAYDSDDTCIHDAEDREISKEEECIPADFDDTSTTPAEMQTEDNQEPDEIPESVPVSDNEPDVFLPSIDDARAPDCENQVETDESLQETAASFQKPTSELAVKSQQGAETDVSICNEETADNCQEEEPKDVLNQNPEQTDTLHEVITSLESLHFLPGDSCATLDGDRAVSGIIDRIEIYSNTILIAVEVGNLRRPFPISEIGKTLFVGAEFMSQAEKVAKGES